MQELDIFKPLSRNSQTLHSAAGVFHLTNKNPGGVFHLAHSSRSSQLTPSSRNSQTLHSAAGVLQLPNKSSRRSSPSTLLQEFSTYTLLQEFSNLTLCGRVFHLTTKTPTEVLHFESYFGNSQPYNLRKELSTLSLPAGALHLTPFPLISASYTLFQDFSPYNTFNTPGGVLHLTSSFGNSQPYNLRQEFSTLPPLAGVLHLTPFPRGSAFYTLSKSSPLTPSFRSFSTLTPPA